MADGAGIRRGVSARIRATIVNGGRELDLTNRTVSAVGRLNNSSVSFVIATTIADSEAGAVDLLISASSISSTTADYVAVEFTITGTPLVNTNEKPLIVPLRGDFVEADR